MYSLEHLWLTLIHSPEAMAEADSCEAAEGLPISGGAIFEQVRCNL